MTNLRMKLHGLRELKARLGKLPAHVRTQAEPAMQQAAELVAADAIDSILTGSRSGIMYGDHQASAPGEPPANQTGELADSIKAVKGSGLSYAVEVSAEHGRHLELGTVNMEARPFLAPALQRNRRRIKNMLNAAVKTAVKLVKGRR